MLTLASFVDDKLKSRAMRATCLCMLLLAASTHGRTIPSSLSLSEDSWSRRSLVDDQSEILSDSGSPGPSWAHDNHDDSSAADSHHDGDESIQFILRQGLYVMRELKDELQRLSGKHSQHEGGSATRDRRLNTAATTSCALEVSREPRACENDMTMEGGNRSCGNGVYSVGECDSL